MAGAGKTSPTIDSSSLNLDDSGYFVHLNTHLLHAYKALMDLDRIYNHGTDDLSAASPASTSLDEVFYSFIRRAQASEAKAASAQDPFLGRHSVAT